MKRLLFISNLFPDADSPVRGLDNAVLLRTLSRQNDLDIRVLSPRPTLRPALVRRLRAAEHDAQFSPEYIATPYLPKIGSFCNAPLMARALRPSFERLMAEHRPEVVLVSWLFPDACAVTKLAEAHDVPTVLITQGSDTHAYLENPSRRRQILAAIEKSAAVICRSADLGNRLARCGAEAEKLHTVYNGVDTSVFQPRDRAQARRELGLNSDPDTRVLLFVGNFLPVKNPSFLLRAHAELAHRIDDHIELVMIGAGPLRQQLLAECEQLGTEARVHLTGSLPSEKVSRYMNAADVLCLSSHNEGFPNVILEAMASGLPVVSTDVGGISELIDESSTHGQLVQPGDLGGYLAALEHWLNPSSAASPSRPGNMAREDLSWENAAMKYARILENCAGRNEQ